MRVLGEIGPFVGVGGLVVEFLLAVGLADVAPAPVADAVVVETVGGERRCGPSGGWLGQQVLEAQTFDTRTLRNAAHVLERGVDAH